jgi:hypothetical protein
MGPKCGVWARHLECEWAMGMGGYHMGPVGNAVMGMGAVTWALRQKCAVTWAPRPECDGLRYGNGGRGVGLTRVCTKEC